MSHVRPAYLAAGANRQTAAADWGHGGTLCYGAGVNLAVWRPVDADGVRHLLGGHQDVVKAVQFLGTDEDEDEAYFVSGGDDRSLKLWAMPQGGGGEKAAAATPRCVQTVEAAHAAPINCIASAKACAEQTEQQQRDGGRSRRRQRRRLRRLFASGGADYAIKIWALERRQGEGEEDPDPDQREQPYYQMVLLQTIKTTPRYFPLCLALVSLTTGDDGGEQDSSGDAAPLPPLPPPSSSSSWMLAAAGTNNRIQIFVGTDAGEEASRSNTSGVAFELQASLAGHEGWVRSLDFGWEGTLSSSDLLLASASQDKYVRLWRIHKGSAVPAPTAAAAAVDVAAAEAAAAAAAAGIGGEEAESTSLDFLPANGNTPANKAHRVRAGNEDYSVTFEALLLGHEDWIYSAKWAAAEEGKQGGLRLLTASADNSLAIWEADAASGIWVTTARLGELSKEKGATTATGSIGGFWSGLWSPDGGGDVVTLCRTGSWRRWTWVPEKSRWVQALGVAGHVAPVTGVAWARDGAYLLSTGGDQTTRLHAEWCKSSAKPGGVEVEAGAEVSRGAAGAASWHEMARPQIHGYDLNCIDSLGASQFVSGADEKLMRVFHEPKTVARLLARLTMARAGGGGVVGTHDNGDNNGSSSATTAGDLAAIDALPDAASMPVLGLSNKAVDADEDVNNDDEDGATDQRTSTAVAEEEAQPPFEDILARNTLWPETEKLYGHGYEISCLAVSHDGRLVASACRASSLNHAVVRLFETAPRWTEVRPPLATHTLTVTRLRFSADDRFLLSVGRDRQWAVFERGRGGQQAARQETEDAYGDDATSAPPPPATHYNYTLLQADSKAHTRMILDCAWAPPPLSSGDATSAGQSSVFATAGRDKNVKVWAAAASATAEAPPSFALATTIPQEHPVTAVDFLWRPTTAAATTTTCPPRLVLAVGTEGGRLAVVSLDAGSLAVSSILALEVGLCLPKAVLQLAWRPPRKAHSGQQQADEETAGADLAIAGEDASLRVYRVEGV